MYDEQTGTHNKFEIALETEAQKRVLTMLTTLDATLSKDGDKFCWLYGENLQVGIAGFGDSPMKAAYDFEMNFNS